MVKLRVIEQQSNGMGDSDGVILSGEDIPIEIPPFTIGEIFFQALNTIPADSVLIVEAESGRSIACGEYLELTVKAAEALQEAGVQPGDSVAVVGKNGIDISAAVTGALYLGARAAPVDPYMKPFEFQQILGIIEPKVLFCDAEIHEAVGKSLEDLQLEVPVILLCGEEDAEYPFQKFEDFVKEDVDLHNFRPVSSEDTSQSIAFLACSSGTTGLPKAVMLSDRSMVYQLLIWRHLAGERKTEDQLWLHVTHFFWISGICLFLACTCSGTVRIVIRNLTSTNILKAVENYRPYFTFMAPAHLDMILNDPDFDTYDLTSIKLISVGGSSLQKPTYDRVLRKWPSPLAVTQGYGCTEMGGAFTYMRLEDDIQSVGQPIPKGKAKIVKDDGEICKEGELGEICLMSESVMNGYLKNEEATENALDADGWFHTGDTGYIKNGLIYITGRLKELIKNQGLQIAPTELEELIRSVPGILDVGVAGIKVDEYNYHPMALVVREEDSDVTEEDVVKCVNENLSDYKQLRGGVCFVTEVPRTPTGKIKRRELQSLAETLYLGD